MVLKTIFKSIKFDNIFQKKWFIKGKFRVDKKVLKR